MPEYHISIGNKTNTITIEYDSIYKISIDTFRIVKEGIAAEMNFIVDAGLIGIINILIKNDTLYPFGCTSAELSKFINVIKSNGGKRACGQEHPITYFANKLMFPIPYQHDNITSCNYFIVYLNKLSKKNIIKKLADLAAYMRQIILKKNNINEIKSFWRRH